MKLGGETPTVLFSVEITARELDSKLVMASALAAQGCRVIVGNKEAITAIGEASDRIVWQGKGLFFDRSDGHLADRLLARGSRIMFMQDEGAMHPVNGWTQGVLQKHYVDQIRKRDVSRVCMWGQRQKDVFVRHAEEAEDIVAVTGSPRFDLCLPKFEWMTADQSKAVRDRYGPYILICTRFTAIAHASGLDDPFRRKLNPRIWPESIDMRSVIDLWFSKWRRDTHDFADFVVLIKEIAALNRNHTLVLRPHPSESMAFYREAFSSLKNVVVTRDGGVLGWIRGADLVVHSNCTTGIEAVLAGRPVLNFLPFGPDRAETDVEVAREAGSTVGSIAEANAKASQFLSKGAPAHSWSIHAQSMLNNLKTEAIPILLKETKAVLNEGRIDSAKVVMPIGRTVRNAVKRLVGRKPSAYVAAKRGALSAAHVEQIVEGCRSNGLGGGRISYLTDQYVVIDPL